MTVADVVVIGGGLAGSMAASKLSRAGFDIILIDPHSTFPDEFRCEKLDARQAHLFEQDAVGSELLGLSTKYDAISIAMKGQRLATREERQYSIPYCEMVNFFRNKISPNVKVCHAKALRANLEHGIWSVFLSGEQIVMARLVVVATGGANSIRSSLGVNRKILSENHSMSFGFDIQTRRPEWHSSALTYYPESTRAKTAYMALFPMRSTVRANLFTYHDPRDPAVRYIKTNPSEALRVLLPEFERIAGNFDVTSPVDTRAVDLYKVDGAETSGAVFIGDAFSTSCPAAGTGVTKVLVDTQRLCDFYVPKWLSRRTIGKHTTEEFYKDSIRKANEKRCLKAAFHHRNFSTSNALWWQMRREIAYLRQTGRGLFQTQEQSVGSRFESDSTLGIS